MERICSTLLCPGSTILFSEVDTALGEIIPPVLLLFYGMKLLGELNAQHLETLIGDVKIPNPDSNYNWNQANLLAEGREDLTFQSPSFLFKKRGK